MGHSWSSRRRHSRRPHQNSSLPPPPPPSSTHPVTLPPPPRPPQPPQQPRPPSTPRPPPPQQPRPPSTQPPPPPSYAFAANAPYPQNPNAILPAPPPPLSNGYNYARPTMGQSNYRPNYTNLVAPAPHLPPPPPPPPPYVDHQTTKKIKNDVNVHKDSIRVVVDEENPDQHLVSFTFDAMVDGSITIFYFGKEGANCSFTVLYPEVHMPVRIPFQKGLGQKFRQPSGTGIDLGFFDINELSKPLTGEEDVFPLIISAESSLLPSDLPDDKKPLNESMVITASHAQITQAILEKTDNESHFQVKVMKQILWIDGIHYELREIYGLSSSTEATSNNGNDSGVECVICMTEPKDTAVLPCRHMCMCHECAQELRLLSDKCPICRQPIVELMEIKVNEEQA